MNVLTGTNRLSLFTVAFLTLAMLLAAPAAAEWADATVPSIDVASPTHGMSWVDYDGDGDLDLYVVNDGTNTLLRNDGEDLGSPGEWLFVDVTVSTGTGNASRGSAGAWGDYDGDGDLDVYIANDISGNRLLRNDPLDPFDPGDLDRIFVDVTVGDLGTTLRTQSVAWVDFDRDGDVDLYMANRTANMLLRNDGENPGVPGEWIFTDVASATGTGSSMNSQACAWGDYDADGDSDLYLTSFDGANLLLRNDPANPGDPDDPVRVFVDVAASVGADDTGVSRGAVWGDFDGDLDLDLYVANFGGANRLYRNDGATFLEIGADSGVDDAGNGRGVGWVDVDHDGDLDLYLVNYNDGVVLMDNVLFLNDGPDGGNPDGWLFTDAADTTLAYADSPTSTAAWGDYDGDGDLDAAIANWGSVYPNRLVRNDFPDTTSWLHVTLTGHSANGRGVGARLRVVAGALELMRELHAGEGLLAFNSPAVEFGLGTEALVDTLEIRWPSGTVQVLTDQAVNQVLAVVEPGPATPVMDPEPAYTLGLENTVSWSDESGTGAVDYFLQAASDPSFTAVVDTSGWIGGLTHIVTGLDDGGTVYYRVRARDAGGYASGWSSAVVSTQDDSAPTSQAEPVDSPRAVLPFLLSFTADDAGSGVALTRLYYGFEDSLNYVLTDSTTGTDPFLFPVAEGVGTYYFYTQAVDDLGNAEALPATYDTKVVLEDLEWVDVAPSDGTGVGNDGNGRGAAWADYDGDGDPDIFITNRPVWQTGADDENHLFRNDGTDGGGGWLFADVSTAEMMDGLYSQGAAWGDYDGDGDLDLYQANMQVDANPAPNRLFRNEGGGAFTEVAAACGVDDEGDGRTVSWCDYDGDGDLDLYLCNDGSNRLYRNDGDDGLGGWIFTNVAPTDGTGAGNDLYTMGCAWHDVDADGDPDLYLTNHDGGANALLRNDGGDVFTDVASSWGVAHTGFGMGCAFGDYDGDGLLDLYVSNLGANALYRRDPGADHFTNVTFTVSDGLEGGLYGAGVAWADYDNDGDLDLYLGNHWTDGPDPSAPNHLWRNDGTDGVGGWTFTDVTPAGGYNIGDDASTNGVAWADFDGDGDLDLYLANMTGVANRLFRNDTADAAANHWLQVDLSARAENTSAIGAELRAVVGGVSMHRRVDGGGGFLSQAAGTIHFGLGAATVVDTLEISWPTGYVQTLVAVAGDQRLAIEEPGPDTPVIDLLHPYSNQSSTPVTWSDESASGAIEYEVILGYDPEFDPVIWTSGWRPDTTYTFTGGGPGATRWFRVHARDAEGLLSYWSETTWVTFDYSDPASSVQPITQGFPGVPFEVDVVGTDDISGIDRIDLFYAFDGGAPVLYGSAGGDTTFVFDIPDGQGEYGFHTVATDSAGNDEDPPGTPDQTVVVAAPAWTNIAPDDGSGIGNDGNSRGLAWGDIDGDGDHDQYITNRIVWSSPGEAINRLMRNDGPDVDPDSWIFTDITAGELGDDDYGQGCAWGDYDGDGDLDLYTSNMQVNPSYPAPNLLFRNDGGGVFTNIAPAAGVDDGDSGRTVSWIDFDMDGDLDLYLCNDGPNRLWRNDGPDGGNPDSWLFVDVAPTDGSGVGDDTYTMGCAWGDYDNDGDPDLYLADHNGVANRLMRNDGPDPGAGYWLFTDVAAAMGVADTGEGLGCAWGDFDGDGWLDLYLTNDGPNRLFRNQVTFGPPPAGGEDVKPASTPTDKLAPTSQVFIDVAGFYDNGLADGQYGAGIAWADYDNDGDLDFYLGNHWPDIGPEWAVNSLFRNDGPDTANADGWLFVNVAPTNGFNIGAASNTNGVTWCDVDDDGDLDLAMASMSGGANKLFRNDVADSTGNHWLHLDLVGLGANTAAIGARVTVVAGGMHIMRDVDGGSGFLSQNSLTLEFGLGAATLADSVIVRWATGPYEILTGVAVDQRMTVTQTATGIGDEPWPQTPLAFRLHRNHPNPFNPSTDIAFELPRRERATLRIYAVDGSLVRTLVNGVLPAGGHRVTWHGRDQRGRTVATGVYFYRLSTAERVETKKMLLLK